MAAQAQISGWTKTVNPPKLSTTQWNVAGLLGVVFVVMAVLQAIGFSDFKDWLDAIGLGSPATWAVGLIIAELLAAVGLFRLKLPKIVAMLSALAAILVAGFWFIENIRLVSQAASGELTNSGFFGKFLHQSPGWWTVIEVTVFLFWVIYSVQLTSSAWMKKR